MNDLEAWLDEMVDAPLPGGLAAAAVAAALGAALVAKVGRIVLARPGLPAGVRAAVEPLAALAQAERRGLLALAAADVEAYRAVLSDPADGPGDAQALPSHHPAPRDARQGRRRCPSAWPSDAWPCGSACRHCWSTPDRPSPSICTSVPGCWRPADGPASTAPLPISGPGARKLSLRTCGPDWKP